MYKIEEVIDALKKGKVVVYPTDTLYGLGANIFNRKAVEKIYKIKKRPSNMPLPIVISSINKINEFAEMNEFAKKIVKKFLPGKLTVVLKKKNIIPDYISKDKVAIRIPANEIALKLAYKFPITATSANLHGGSLPVSIEIVKKQLGKKPDIYLDYGKLSGLPSTVVDVSCQKIKIIREGAIKKEELYV